MAGGKSGLLRADRAWVVRPRTTLSEGVGPAFALSGTGHLLLGLALSWVVWSATPPEPVTASVAVVFEAPADQAPSDQSPADQPSADQPPPDQAATPAPQQETASVATEPTPPEPPQPEPPPAEPPPEHAEAVPMVPPPEVLPPPAQEPILQPPPLPHAKPPPPKQLAARPPPTKPALQKPGPVTAQPAQPVPNASAGQSTPQPSQASPVAAGWNTLFSAWLAARKTYPEAARRHGEQGNVTLHFRVAMDGTVLEVALVSGSGSPALDEAARSLLRDAKVPPPQTEISRTVRLRYRLDD